MAGIAVSITKRVPFRGGVQEFSNTYYYQDAAGSESVEEANGIIDEVVAAERSLHSNGVTFDRARAWTWQGTIDENVTLVMRDLSGTGANTYSGAEDPERAVLVKWYNGRDSLGRRKYLKKWYHLVTSSLGLNQADIVGQQGRISQASRDAIATTAQNLANVGAGAITDSWTLCSPSGDPYESDAVTYPWLEHHQFGDQWRDS